MDGASSVAPRDGLSRESLFTITLIALRVVILILVVARTRPGSVGGPDVFRFHSLAFARGTPWRDYQVEYAPLELFLIRSLFAVSLVAAAIRLAILELVADLATWAGVVTGWGRRAGLFYLAVGLPLVLLEFRRIDLVPVAVTLWAFLLARRSRPVAAGAGLGIAVLMKIWPLVLAPGVWVLGKTRSLLSFVAVTVAGLVGWIAWGGFGAVSQVTTFRNASGWEVGSTVGSLIWIVTGAPIREEAGAVRVGTAPGWAKIGLGLLLASILLIVWRRADRDDNVGGASFTAVAALLFLTPLFSAQYALWLLPWAAVAAIDDAYPAVILAGTFIVSVATAFIGSLLYNGGSDSIVKIASIVRLLVLAAMVVRGLMVTPSTKRSERPIIR